MNIPSVPPELLVTDEARAELEHLQSNRSTVAELFVAGGGGGGGEDRQVQKNQEEIGKWRPDK